MSAQSPRPTDSDGAGSRMTRRGLFKRSAVVGGSLVAIGGGVDRLAPRYSPIGRAQALSAGKTFLVGMSGVAGVLVGAGYMLGSGSSDDAAEEINEARANELHDRIWLDANEMQMTQTPMLESLSGDVTMLRQICRSDAAFALMQAASDQKSEADATADGKAVVEETVANVEANFFDAWSSQMVRLQNRVDLAKSEDQLDIQNVFRIGTVLEGTESYVNEAQFLDGTGLRSINHLFEGELSVPLVDGTATGVNVVYGCPNYFESGETQHEWLHIPWSNEKAINVDLSSSDGTPSMGMHGVHYDEVEAGTSADIAYSVETKQREGGEVAETLNARDWWEIHDQLLSLLEEEKANVETMVSTFYQEALNGEVNLHEMSSASAILQAADTLDNWKQAAGAYRAMVMPEATDPAVIELENGVQLEGLLFWSDPDPDEGLVVDQITNPANTIGRIYMAAEIRSVPETPESSTYDVTVTVVDDDTDATPLEGISITVKGTDATATTDANGEATISLPEGPRTLYLSGPDSGGTSHETGQTFEISSENTSVEVTHDGGDRTSVQADPFADETLTQENVGDVVIPYLTDPFTLKGIDGRPDATNLMFNEPDRVEPDDDFDKQKENSQRAAENEEETREETTTIVIEETSDGGPARSSAAGTGSRAAAVGCSDSASLVSSSSLYSAS